MLEDLMACDDTVSRVPDPIRARPALALARTLASLLLAPACSLADNPDVPPEVPRIAAHAQAPFALSANGLWQAFTDSANVVHRHNLATGKSLPDVSLGALKTKSLAISGDGSRVAWLTRSGCIGFLEVGASPAVAATPRVTWLPSGNAIEPASPRLYKATVWPAHPPAVCDEDRYAGFALALSDDGRLLATSWEVIDLGAHRLVGRLPAERGPIRTSGLTLLLRFVDQDRRLLAVSRNSGRDEQEGAPQTWAATWNLADGSLANLVGLTTSSTPRSFVGYADRSGQLAWTETAPLVAGEAYSLRQASATACADDSTPPTRVALPDFGWNSFVADPFGRWVAGASSLGVENHPEDDGPDALSVIDVASGRVVDRRELPFRFVAAAPSADGRSLAGLAVSGDGASPAGPNWGETPVSWSANRPVRLPIRHLADGVPAPAAPRWMDCRIGSEQPGARSIERREAVLKRSWSRTIAAAPAVAAEPSEAAGQRATSTVCIGGNGAGAISLAKDSAIWLDQAATVEELDPATGHSRLSWPAPRKKSVCSRLSAPTGGFVNAQGDTLSWRSMQDANDGRLRRVIDVRPGWFVHDFLVDDRVLVATWRHKQRQDPGSPPEREQVATYRTSDFKLMRTAERVSSGSDDVEPLADDLAPCVDALGPIESGLDFRIDVFDSYRAYDCSRRGAPQTVFWSGMDLNRPWADVGPSAYLGSDAMVSRDGDWGAVLDDATVRVFDLRRRLEIGHVVLPAKQALSDLQLVAAAHLLMLRVTDYGTEGAPLRWDAYRIE